MFARYSARYYKIWRDSLVFSLAYLIKERHWLLFDTTQAEGGDVGIFYVVMMLSGIDAYNQTVDKWQWQETLRVPFPGFIRAKAKRVET